MVVDESIIPFCSRLFFRYHKKSCVRQKNIFGHTKFTVARTKLFLIWQTGYHDSKIVRVVIKLEKNHYNRNYYTSIRLAKYLKGKECELYGTIRKNKKHTYNNNKRKAKVL